MNKLSCAGSSDRLAARALALALAIFAALLCAAALSLAPASAHAADSDGYSYTVRVWGGNQGTLNGGERADYTATYGQTFKLDKGWVALNDGSKYYVKGFRLSGQDDLHAEAFTVTEDVDFVVAYGVQGDMVSYTINFVEYETGTVLAEPVTYYGNIGDKPVASFEYIDGYRPRYRNITGTLGEEGTNSFTFEYIPLAEGESEDGTVVAPPASTEQVTAGEGAGGAAETGATTTAGTTVTGNAQAGATAATPAPAAAGAAAGAAGAAGAGEAAGAAAGGDAAAAGGDAEAEDNAAAGADAGAGAAAEAIPAEPPATEEILDTDNPLASSAGDDGALSLNPSLLEGASTATGIPAWAFALAGALIIAAAVGFGFFFYRRRKQEEEDEALYY